MSLQSSILPANIEFQNLFDVQQPYKSSCYQPEATEGPEKTQAQCGIYMPAALEAPEVVGGVLGKHRLH